MEDGVCLSRYANFRVKTYDNTTSGIQNSSNIFRYLHLREKMTYKQCHRLYSRAGASIKYCHGPRAFYKSINLEQPASLGTIHLDHL